MLPVGWMIMPAALSPFTVPLHNREKIRAAGRHRLSTKQIRSAAIFSQKMTCLHGGNGATACSCASSVTFGVVVPPTRDEWRHIVGSLRDFARIDFIQPVC